MRGKKRAIIFFMVKLRTNLSRQKVNDGGKMRATIFLMVKLKTNLSWKVRE